MSGSTVRLESLMFGAYLPLHALLFGGGLVLAAALAFGAHYGPHRLWSLTVFIAGIAIVLRSRIGEYGIPIMFKEMPAFTLTLTAIAYASFVTALTIQCLRAWRTATAWQVGAGAVAAEATLVTGVSFMDGC